MALTPDDLTSAGLLGFGTGVSVLGDGQTVASFLAVWRADPQGELARVIAAAAPTRIHLLWIGKPSVSGNPDSSTERFVFSYAFEIAGLADRGSTDIRTVTSTLGGSVVLTTYMNASGRPTFRADIQQGSTVSTLLFRGAVLADQALVETVAGAQLACLAQGQCLEPVSLSQSVEDEVQDRRDDAALSWS